MDRNILSRLQSALSRDRWVRPEADAIGVALTGHGIILTGSTRTLAAKKRAVILADMVGRLPVIDCLRRRPAGISGDGEIARQVCTRLEQEPEFQDYGIALANGREIEAYRHSNASAHDITISVDEGAIELSGSVGSLDRLRLAEVICWWIDDCQFVDNDLEVSPRQDDSDEQISDAVRLCLDKDLLIESAQLHVQTAAAVVRIEGPVGTESQRARMLLDVWAVPGVRDVDDCTQVPATQTDENTLEAWKGGGDEFSDDRSDRARAKDIRAEDR